MHYEPRAVAGYSLRTQYSGLISEHSEHVSRVSRKRKPLGAAARAGLLPKA